MKIMISSIKAQILFQYVLYQIQSRMEHQTQESIAEARCLAKGQKQQNSNCVRLHPQKIETQTKIVKFRKVDSSQLNHFSTDFSNHSNTSQLSRPHQNQQSGTDRLNQNESFKNILRTGYLQKRTKSLLNRWQICYCLLNQSKLYCFEDEMRINLVSCINFEIFGCQIRRENQNIHIQMSEFGQEFIVKAYSENEAVGWFNDIGRIIQYYSNHDKVKFMQGKNHIYSEKDGYTEKQFLNLAETGDILLMATSDATCALQRFVTNSQYDHVALVIRFANNQVKIFESNPDDGVNVYDWDEFNSAFHQYEKISFRKLHIGSVKRQELQQLLLKFIKNTIGKKYDLNAIKLIRKTSQDEYDQQRGYFCSQLTAKVYKKAGLLASERASNSYWPMDFTGRGALNLLESASLGEQMLIILNKHLKFNY